MFAGGRRGWVASGLLTEHSQGHSGARNPRVGRRRQKDIITAFDLCVANREKGEPGSLDPRLIHWHADAEGYEGAYSWLHSTWIAQGGSRYAYHAYEASPRQQSIIFDKWSRIDPGAWPNTVPPCLYLEH